MELLEREFFGMGIFRKSSAGRGALSEFQRCYGHCPAILLAAIVVLTVVMGVTVAGSGSALLSQSRETELFLRRQYDRDGSRGVAGNPDQRDRIGFGQAYPLRTAPSFKGAEEAAASQSRE
jgi:hypothetical protein